MSTNTLSAFLAQLGSRAGPCCRSGREGSGKGCGPERRANTAPGVDCLATRGDRCPTFAQAERALQALAKHPLGHDLAQKVNAQLDRLFFSRLDCHRGLGRTGPEWLWRDFRARPSRGRNHGTAVREERAASSWMVYHHFTPAQRRLERKRHTNTLVRVLWRWPEACWRESVIWMHCKSEACR